MNKLATELMDLNLADLSSEAHLKDPFSTYKGLRQHAPVCQVLPGPIWAVSRYRDVAYVMRNPELFSSTGFKAMGQPDWLKKECHRDLFIIAQDPPEHTKYRSLVNKAFVNRVINALVPHMEEKARGLVGHMLTKNGPVDFVGDFAYPYIGSVIGKIVGTEESQDLGQIRRWLELTAKLSPQKPDAPFIVELEDAILNQNRHFHAIIKDRRKHPRNDLVTALINAEIDGVKLSDERIRSALELFLTAGLHTAIQLMSRAILELSQRPQLLELLIRRSDLIPAFIEEMMRYDPPAHCALRQTTAPVCLSGVEIPRQALVLVMLASANHDPDVFQRPEQFDITRQNVKQHLAFGHGVHACIGAALVRLEVKIALEKILGPVRSISCPRPDQLRWEPSYLNRGVLELPIELNNQA